MARLIRALRFAALLILGACAFANPNAKPLKEGSPKDCRQRCAKYKPESVTWAQFYFFGETADREKYKRCKKLCRR